MDVTHLRYFTTVYEQKNITAAAALLNLSQQGLSKSIRKLEETFESPLFYRTRAGLVPTEFGRTLYQEAQKILTQYQASMAVLQAAKKETTPLKIGFPAEIYHTLALSGQFQAFFSTHPDIPLITKILSSDDCESMVLSGDLDAAFAEGPFHQGECAWIPLLRERFFTAISENHPLAGRKTIQLPDLHGQALSIADSTTKGANHFLRQLDHRKVSYHIAYRGVDVSIQRSLVHKDRCVAVFPEHVLDAYRDIPGVVTAEITGVPCRELVLLYRQTPLQPKNTALFVRWMEQRFSGGDT